MKKTLLFTAFLCLTLCAYASSALIDASKFAPGGGNMKKDMLEDPSGKKIRCWRFSKNDPKNMLHCTLQEIPEGCAGLCVEADFSWKNKSVSGVFTLRMKGKDGKYVNGRPVRIDPFNEKQFSRRKLLESYFPAEHGAPVVIELRRMTQDPNDGKNDLFFTGLHVRFLEKPASPLIVQEKQGYNSWPMIGKLGKKLVCAYSCGTRHNINEAVRGAYARCSGDEGKTWSNEVCIANAPDECEVTIGKGPDGRGNLLFLIRCLGKKGWHHDVYRTRDGVHFERIAFLSRLSPMPMQITDIFEIPGKGLMALWFAGRYRKTPEQSWGTLFSTDGGKTWEQKTVEDKLILKEWPTEISAVCLGNGRILAVARTEHHAKDSEEAQFQLVSRDNGKTWKRSRTNITDVNASTPSLLYDPSTDVVTLYYYHRGRGNLLQRRARASMIFEHPLLWSDPKLISVGSTQSAHSGNVNAVRSGDNDFLAYYTGTARQTSVVVSRTPALKGKK